MRTAVDVINRIQWDPVFDKEKFIIGYLDRFLGVKEKAFTKFEWTHDFHNVLEWDGTVLQHRIMYFKYKGVMVWDKTAKLDIVFGSSIPPEARYKSLEDIDAVVGDMPSGDEKDTEEDTNDKRRGRGGKGRFRGVDPDDVGGSDVVPAEALRTGLLYTPVDRPSHFVCFKVTNPAIKEHASHVQASVVGAEPRLRASCIPLSALHVTLCTLRIVTQPQLEAAISALNGIKAELCDLLPKTNNVSFSGVGCFRGRVVYGAVIPSRGLVAAQTLVCDRLRSVGLDLVGTRGDYVPHMTIVKMNRAATRLLHEVDVASYGAFTGTQLGWQPVLGIHLCSMVLPKGANGFYYTAASVKLDGGATQVPPSLPVQPPAPAALLRDISLGAKEGWLPMDIKSNLKDRVLTATADTLAAVSAELVSRKAGFTTAAGAPHGGAPLTDVPPALMLSRRTSELVQQGRVPPEMKASIQALAGSSAGNAVNRLAQVLGVGVDDSDTTHGSMGIETKGSEDTSMHVVDGFVVWPFDTLLDPGVAAEMLRATVAGPLVIILRGVPGSGKSTFVKALGDTGFSNTYVCSADHYFERSGRYIFDASKLGTAHAACKDKFLTGLFTKQPVVIVDNTNTTPKEYKPYMKLARVFDYTVAIVSFACTEDSLPLLAARNAHGVPLDKLVIMWKRMVPEPGEIRLQVNFSKRPQETVAKSTVSEQYSRSLPTWSPRGHYVAVFFDDATIQDLLAEFKPMYGNVTCDHVTLQFEPDWNTLFSMPYGRKVQVDVIGCFFDSRVQACPVRLGGDIVSGNKIAHITVSVAHGANAVESNGMLEDLGLNVTHMDPIMSVTGVIGLCTRGSDTPITSYLDVHRWAVCRGAQPTSRGTCLHVFDFDHTLFCTPDEDDGSREYFERTGTAVDPEGWLRNPVSLMPPMNITPGPALVDYFEHAGRENSATVIITGRSQDVHDVVSRVAGDFGVHPDRLVTKRRLESSTIYKPIALTKILDEMPGISHVKIWDDDEGCTKAYMELAKSHQNVSWTFIPVPPAEETKASNDTSLRGLLGRLGKIATPFRTATMKQAVQLVEQCWNLVLLRALGDADAGKKFRQTCYVFGSAAIGCGGSDLDVVLLAPSFLTTAEACERLEAELLFCGVRFVYTSTRSRVPRVACRITSPDAPPVDVDCTIACIPKDMLYISPTCDSFDALCDMVHDGTNTLEAVRMWSHVSQELPTDASDVVLGVNTLLQAQRLKGNQFHCLRTFHIIAFLMQFLSVNAWTDAEDTFRRFCGYMSGLSYDRFKGTVGETPGVPRQYFEHYVAAFHIGSTITDFRELCRKKPFPLSSAFDVVSISLKCPHEATMWYVLTFLRGRLGTYVRKILDSGVPIVPNGSTSESLEFCVPRTGLRKPVVKELQALVADIETMVGAMTYDYTVDVSVGADAVASLTVRSVVPYKTILDIPQDVLTLLTQFDATASQRELVLPPTLTAAQRGAIHTWATEHGYKHASRNTMHGRCLTVSK